MFAAAEPLPLLDSPFPVLPSVIEDFRREGFAITRKLLDPSELRGYRGEIDRAVRAYNTETRPLAERDTYGKAFLQIMNLWRRDARVRSFSLSKRFAGVAAQLLGVKNVRMYHDQALFKESGGGPTPWHQDQYYWPMDTPNTVTLWMPLVPVTPDMGLMSFVIGSHRKGAVFNTEISDESEEAFENYIRDHHLHVRSTPFLDAGDASWHYGFTIHNATANTSGKMREVMTVIYVADGARVTSPANRWQENDRIAWLDARKPGELVDSALNPLLL